MQRAVKDVTDTGLLERIAAGERHFSKGQRLIAVFIRQHYDRAAFMTANRLGKVVGVSESTVVRFAVELGYDGYPSMQRALRGMIRNRLTAVQRLEVAQDRLGRGDMLRGVIQSDIENLRATLEELDRDAFSASVEAILRARQVYILGVRSSAALASFLSFYLHLLCDNVRLVSPSSVSDIFEQVLRVGPEDLVIGFSFPRYSRRTVRAMRYAHDRGATLVAITDSKLSPLIEVATYTLLTHSDMISFVDSLVSPLSLINALVVEIGMRKQQEAAQTFDALEQIWDEYEVYEKEIYEKNE
ncbi:MAG: MurR/RpiR family transcriptional regulator [Oscillospiraceae bacterium]|jgi:DNA-binding MurR/RpiR family transcriptional regulator|nr:MurR/RpiR family transcriptional regulator [Oscillospiraceae bacterium]